MKRLGSFLLCAALMLGLLSVTALAGEDDVEINETNFPDAVFRQYVSDNFDKSPKDGVLSASEIAVTKSISVERKGISSLKGIEHFTELTSLFCFSNNLTQLDVSKNTKLTSISCFSNKLTSLDVRNNPALVTLACHLNNLTSLDVSSNPALSTISCHSNKLTELDVSNNPALRNLYCNSNQLTSLNLNNCTLLSRLDCYSNKLTSLDLQDNTSLQSLYCSDNQLTTLDLSSNTALKMLSCGSNHLTSLDISQNTALTSLLASNEVYPITVPSTTRTFDLTTLPGNFDVSEASNWSGGTVSGNTLNVNQGASSVTYTYNCGNDKTMRVTLIVTVHEHIFDQEIANGETLKTPADCTNDAVYYKSCSCGEIGTEETFTDVGSVLGHDHSGDWQYEDEKGHFKVCARTGCDEKLDQKAHTYGDWEVTKDPTETEPGQKERTCSACRYTDTAVIPVLEHTHKFSSEWEYDVENHWHECIAGDGERSEEAAHTFGDWVVTIAPTDTGKGQKERSCSACGYSETAVVPPNRVIIIEPDEPNGPTDANSNHEEADNPATGDSTDLILWTTLLLASGAGMISMVAYGRRRMYK